jgi:hypothetical protein
MRRPASAPNERLWAKTVCLEDETFNGAIFEGIVGRSEALRRVLIDVALGAPTVATV